VKYIDKKGLIFVALSVYFSLTLFAQGFYFDVGLGVGYAWTLADGENIADKIKSEGFYVEEERISPADFSLKAGYGPIGNLPLYTVVEMEQSTHSVRFWDEYDSSYIFISSNLIGPGVLFYPIPFIQLGSSLGISFVRNKLEGSQQLPKSKVGFAWNISAAADLGKYKHGCLIGIKYFISSHTLETDINQRNSMIAVFVKYTYRHKPPSLF
jgi:hypothetical protein